MKGELTLHILESLEGVAHTAAFLFDVFTSGYGESYRKLRRGPPLNSSRSRWRTDEARIRHNYQVFLSSLKRDGLIDAASSRSRVHRLTSKGFERLARLRERWKHRLPVSRYRESGVSESTIVVFDVPEGERKKRSWLRAVLKRLQFKMIQKSVWFGVSKLPSDFLEDMRRCGVWPYVEIFSITKRGTLRRRTSP